MRKTTLLLVLSLWLLADNGRGADRHMLLHGGGYYSTPGFAQFAEWAAQGNRKVYVFTWGGLAEPETTTFSILRRKLLSSSPDTALEVLHAPPPSDAQVQSQAFVKSIDEASGVFFAGGDQARIMTDLEKMPNLRKAIQEGYRRGSLVYGGDSAGAAMAAETMIASSVNTRKIEVEAITFNKGMGLLKSFTVDQHFTQRPERHNRVHAIALSMNMPVITVDERTAIGITNEQNLQVFGENFVSIINPQGKRKLKIDYLVHGESFDLETCAAKE